MVAETRSASNKKRKLAHASSAPAFERTLALTELLTAILLHVDQQTLLVSAQRTCQRWNEVIKTVPSLRRHLFLDVPCDGAEDADRVFNPLLQQAFGSFFDNVAEEDAISTDKAGEIYRAHPGMMASTKLYKAMVVKGRPLTYKDFKDGRVQAREEANPFLRADASWLRMQITDPPTVRVGIFRRESVWRTNTTMACTTDIEGGLRMQDLYTTFLGSVGRSRTGGNGYMTWPRHRHGTFLVKEGKFGSDFGDEAWGRSLRVEAELMIYTFYARGCGKGLGIADDEPVNVHGHIFFDRDDMTTRWSSFVYDAVERRRREASKRKGQTMEHFDDGGDGDSEEQDA